MHKPGDDDLSAHERDRKAPWKALLEGGKPIKAFLKTDRANGKIAPGAREAIRETKMYSRIRLN